jgi:DNA-binding CsgD family transcriptional regulator
LTAAEARIAALVGKSYSARETAAALGLSVNTVTSTLKVIYDKLGFEKQTELAVVVDRLATIFPPKGEKGLRQLGTSG